MKPGNGFRICKEGVGGGEAEGRRQKAEG